MKQRHRQVAQRSGCHHPQVLGLLGLEKRRGDS
jgi:hypothetical protein